MTTNASHVSEQRRPRIALTMGDVNGIGPEIIAKALARFGADAPCSILVVGSLAALGRAREFAPRAPDFHMLEEVSGKVPGSADAVPVFPAGVPDPDISPGRIDGNAGRCAMAWVRAAVELALRAEVDAIVTCPIHKEAIRLGGCDHTGHTDYIARLTGSSEYRMSLFSPRLRIVHVSGHHSLREAIALVRKDRIAETIRIGDDALRRLAFPRRRIAVAGLNPHAGEAGLLGDEERREIAPAVETCRAQHIDCSGPYSPDVVFRRAWQGEWDLVVAMYHDQGHIPLKLVAMDEGVNVTLGLPIVRTSVDHGTAFDIAWKGIAREQSLCAAIELAAGFARRAPQPVRNGRRP